jgi:hypothetical protein
MKIVLKIGMLICILAYTNVSYGQLDGNKLYITMLGATEPVDDRIVGIPRHRYEQFKSLNKITPPCNTRYWGIGIGYNLFRKWNFSFDVGLRYAHERNNYIRPFDQCVLVKEGNTCTYELRSLDVYSYNLLGMNFNMDYYVRIISDIGIKIGIGISPLSKFKSFYHEDNTLYETYHHLWKFDFFSLELNPHISLFYKNIEIDAFYRLWQYKKVERGIHPKWSDGFGQIEEDYESFNPKKIGISLKYRFNLKKRRIEE